MNKKMVVFPGEIDKEIQKPGLIKRVISPEKGDPTGMIIHPNTKKVLFEKKFGGMDAFQVLRILNVVLKTKFNDVETWYVEQKQIARPAKGKMQLKTEEAA